ncbi:hypothetical protein CPB83DRAFT_897191 [Crepidotus variabilis]|uniref:PPPDE domain-containing protein n=1 Tax=Crepidotus variabilis TaxID=179855 RepID=A0A9P6EAA3_9AGAR|nr:hypothetical protein CPB83DRAFT_897191 [Crepidotus variabilis]
MSISSKQYDIMPVESFDSVIYGSSGSNSLSRLSLPALDPEQLIELAKAGQPAPNEYLPTALDDMTQHKAPSNEPRKRNGLRQFLAPTEGYVPMYLVKRELENPLPEFVGKVADDTHWALEIRGQHYHLGVSDEGNKTMTLSKENIAEKSIIFRCEIGKTRKTDAQITTICNSVLEKWRSKNKGYNIMYRNCQHFANLVWMRLISMKIMRKTVFWHDLKGNKRLHLFSFVVLAGKVVSPFVK